MLRSYAKKLRKQQTDAESLLWYYLRGKRTGFKFKRQAPMYGYIVDFVCHSRNLIIELDGSQHVCNQHYDSRRTRLLEKRGYQVLRFWNTDVLTSPELVLQVIYETLSPTLSREGENQNTLSS